MKLNRYLIILHFVVQSVISLSTQPSDHLVPPPPIHNRNPPQNFRIGQTEPSGFMQRIARWFGFGESGREQQILQESYQHPQYKEAPYNYQYNRQKAPCNPCNKIPWLPMFPGNLQYPILKGQSGQPQFPQIKYNYHPNNNFVTNQHVNLPTYTPQLSQQQLPSLQYAPAFNFQSQDSQKLTHSNIYPSVNHIAQNPEYRPDVKHYYQIAPIPVPNLSASPIPPLYNHVPFNDLPRVNRHHQFLEPETQLSQVREVIPTQIDPSQSKPSNSNPSVEIVKSIPLTDYVSSVEYPVHMQQSQVIDLSTEPKPNSNYLQNDVPKLIELGSYEPNSFPLQQNYHTSHPPQQPQVGNYEANHPPPKQSQFNSHDLNHSTPQSQLGSYEGNTSPTQLSSYESNNPSSQFKEQSQFISQPIVVHHHHIEPDNFPEASSHNISYRHENHLDIGNFPNESPEIDDILIVTEAPLTIKPNISTEVVQTHVEFQPSLQTISEEPVIVKSSRQTPKKLLDSPIFYSRGNSPKPFTKDPSDLRVHSSSYEQNPWKPSVTATPWVYPSTSTYTSLDASGQWAGISPPTQFQPTPHSFILENEKRPKQIHQIIIPYTSNNQPRPFKLRGEQSDQPTTDDVRYANWSHSHEIELHEQQESKLVTATEQPIKKTTKYLTKILATNIRELLKKEHEIKNKTNKLAFDFSKLQNNIDDWTEQEFTSLINKGSTVSIRGRSKHIPNEYLTTTPSLTDLKTSTISPEVPNTTNFSPSALLDEEESKKYEALEKLIENNRIEGLETERNVLTTSTTSRPSITPFYIRAVSPTTSSLNGLWNNLKVSISPITKEKVYVVTPQPQFQYQTTSSDSLGTFKSPRFLIRPTPGSGSYENLNDDKKHTPELFGLLGISAYNSPVPIETIDGHSKEITVVTPSSNQKRSTNDDDNRSSETKSEVTS